MLKSTLSIFLLVFCCLVFSANNVPAQDEGPITGAYGRVNKNDAQVKASAKFAVKARAKSTKRSITLISISKAEQQVVSGMNYKVCMKVRDGRRTRWATAVVYRHWGGTRQLSSWDWGACNW
jgi:Aspartic acid proteinase inhibitor